MVVIKGFPDTWQCVCGRELYLEIGGIHSYFDKQPVLVKNTPYYHCSHCGTVKFARKTRVRIKELLEKASPEERKMIDYNDDKIYFILEWIDQDTMTSIYKEQVKRKVLMDAVRHNRFKPGETVSFNMTNDTKRIYVINNSDYIMDQVHSDYYYTVYMKKEE